MIYRYVLHMSIEKITMQLKFKCEACTTKFKIKIIFEVIFFQTLLSNKVGSNGMYQAIAITFTSGFFFFFKITQCF